MISDLNLNRHVEHQWVVKLPNGDYYYQPNQGQLVTGKFIHSAHKYKSPKKALKDFTKVLQYVDGGDRVIYDLVKVYHIHIYEEEE